jgi:hypothetical protein
MSCFVESVVMESRVVLFHMHVMIICHAKLRRVSVASPRQPTLSSVIRSDISV